MEGAKKHLKNDCIMALECVYFKSRKLRTSISPMQNKNYLLLRIFLPIQATTVDGAIFNEELPFFETSRTFFS